jgi:hypothetical protein
VAGGMLQYGYMEGKITQYFYITMEITTRKSIPLVIFMMRMAAKNHHSRKLLKQGRNTFPTS